VVHLARKYLLPALLLAMPLLARAHADDYPSRPIRLIVPYSPGGGADSVARVVAKRVGETIGQPVVIWKAVAKEADVTVK
jgi:tripartite-type tricarboxylate transporter receptor subunit TctC